MTIDRTAYARSPASSIPAINPAATSCTSAQRYPQWSASSAPPHAWLVALQLWFAVELFCEHSGLAVDGEDSTEELGPALNGSLIVAGGVCVDRFRGQFTSPDEAAPSVSASSIAAASARGS